MANDLTDMFAVDSKKTRDTEVINRKIEVNESYYPD